MDSLRQVAVTDTDSARQYLVQWMRKHFETDTTFAVYIEKDLAGDFAWQLAKALSGQAAAAAGLALQRHQAAAEAREALEDALEADQLMSKMPHWGGVHTDMESEMRHITEALNKFSELFPVLLPQPHPFAGPWTSVDDAMPEDRIRVWASTSKFDVGHDCFYGGRSSIQQDQTRLWRYTHSEEPVKQPITHWMSLPDAPGAEDLRDPFAVLKRPLGTN